MWRRDVRAARRDDGDDGHCAADGPGATRRIKYGGGGVKVAREKYKMAKRKKDTGTYALTCWTSTAASGSCLADKRRLRSPSGFLCKKKKYIKNTN